MSEQELRLDLVILEQLRRPCERAKRALSDIEDELASSELRPITLGGLYILVYSQLEAVIADTLMYLYRRNPWKMQFHQLPVDRSALLKSELTRDILERHAEKVVEKLTYGSMEAALEQFAGAFGRDRRELAHLLPSIDVIRRRRNEIIHGRTLADRDRGRSSLPGQPELAQAVSTCLAAVETMEGLVGGEYEGHTHVAALRRLWAYLFDSPIMAFDDYWQVNDEEDRVVAWKKCELVSQLSSSERILLGVWRAEFSSDSSLLREFSMKRLDSSRRRDLVTLIAVLRDIWL